MIQSKKCSGLSFILTRTLGVTLLALASMALIPAFQVINGMTIGRADRPFSPTERLTVVFILNACCLIPLLFEYISRGRPRRELLASRMIRELLLVETGIICSLFVAFLLSTITLNPNVYLYQAVFAGLFYFILILATSRYSVKSVYELIRDEFISWPMVFLTVFGLTSLFAVLRYKENIAFRNSANELRSLLNTSVSDEWQLVDVFPGQVFNQPIYVQPSREERSQLYLLTRHGQLFRINRGRPDERQLLIDLSGIVNTDIENGALGFALHPDFAKTDRSSSGYVFIYYTVATSDTQLNRLSRFNLNKITPSGEPEEVILIEQGRSFNGSHNAGTVVFGKDGFLYFSTGDFGEPKGLQRIDYKLAAGIFRIDVNKTGGKVSRPVAMNPVDGRVSEYYIPLSNPFAQQDGVLGEFWALGLRNPFRFSLDEVTGEAWIGDVGSDEYEEINRFTPGDNGGWPVYEGRQTIKSKGIEIGRLKDPFAAFAQTSLFRAIIGGIVYRGDKYGDLVGKYIFAENQTGLVLEIDPNRQGEEPRQLTRTKSLGQFGITSVVEDINGDILITTLGDPANPSGRILKLVKVPSEETDAMAKSVIDEPEQPENNAIANFAMHCSRCHGIDGKGTPLRYLASRPDFSSAEWQSRVTDEWIMKVIREGGRANNLNEAMPAWRDTFKPDELKDLIRLIRSFGDI